MNNQADEPISILVKHFVKPDCQKGFLDWNEKLKRSMAGVDGFMGQMMFPCEGKNPVVYHAVFQFSSIENLGKWWKSEEYSKARVKLSDLVVKQPEFKYTNGLEHWFQPPGSSQPYKPPTYKMAVVVYVALVPLIFAVRAWVNPVLSGLADWEVILIGTAVSVTIMSYAAVPLCTRLFSSWLYPRAR